MKIPQIFERKLMTEVVKESQDSSVRETSDNNIININEQKHLNTSLIKEKQRSIYLGGNETKGVQFRNEMRVLEVPVLIHKGICQACK
jgi:hypothetical protein